jgi:hypothetical protein
MIPLSVTSSRVVVLEPDAKDRDLSVSSERTSGELRQSLIEDFRMLNEALSGAAPENIWVRHVQLTDGRLIVDYTLGDQAQAKDAFIFDYRLIERNGWSCRIGALQRIGPDSTGGTPEHVIERFGRVEDAAGVDLTRPPHPSADGSGYRLLLDGLFVLGLNAFRVLGPP